MRPHQSITFHIDQTNDSHFPINYQSIDQSISQVNMAQLSFTIHQTGKLRIIGVRSIINQSFTCHYQSVGQSLTTINQSLQIACDLSWCQLFSIIACCCDMLINDTSWVEGDLKIWRICRHWLMNQSLKHLPQIPPTPDHMWLDANKVNCFPLQSISYSINGSIDRSINMIHFTMTYHSETDDSSICKLIKRSIYLPINHSTDQLINQSRCIDQQLMIIFTKRLSAHRYHVNCFFLSSFGWWLINQCQYAEDGRCFVKWSLSLDWWLVHWLVDSNHFIISIINSLLRDPKIHQPINQSIAHICQQKSDIVKRSNNCSVC